MKKILHYSVVLILTVILSGGIEAIAHVPRRKTKSSKVVLGRPAAPAIVLTRSEMTRTGYIWIDRHHVRRKLKGNYIEVGGQHLKKRRGERRIKSYWEKINRDRIYRSGCWNRVLSF